MRSLSVSFYAQEFANVVEQAFRPTVYTSPMCVVYIANKIDLISVNSYLYHFSILLHIFNF